MSDQKTILAFNADLQREAEHTLDIDQNGEIVLTCVENGRFLKFPAGTSADDLKALLAKHKEENEGQVTVEAMEAKKAEILEALAPETPEATG